MPALWYRFQQRIAITSYEALTLAAVATLLSVGTGLRAWDGRPVDPLGEETVSAYVMGFEAMAVRDTTRAPGAGATPPDPLPSPSAFSARHAAKPTGPLHIDPNTAAASELARLPRIGPAMAARIIAQREIRPFTSAEDMLAVRGIGPKTLETLRPHLTL